MNPTERTIRLLAGTLVTISIVLGYFVSPYWHFLALFVGLNMFQSVFSKWCLAETIITNFGIGFKK